MAKKRTVQEQEVLKDLAKQRGIVVKSKQGLGTIC